MFKQAVAAAVGTAAVLALAASPVQAQSPVPLQTGPHSEFQIHMSSIDGGGSASITLSCPPEWSEHPSAEAACGQLEGVDGYIEEIAPMDGICTKEYAPVMVLVMGHWHGVHHIFLQKYGNRCEANLATGGHLLDI